MDLKVIYHYMNFHDIRELFKGDSLIWLILMLYRNASNTFITLPFYDQNRS